MIYYIIRYIIYYKIYYKYIKLIYSFRRNIFLYEQKQNRKIGGREGR